MSIQDEINRINQNVANTYSALSEMGATLPEAQNSDNIANAVRTIPQNANGNSCTLAISCAVDFTEMKAKNIYVDKQTIVDAFNANKYIYVKADVSQIANGATSYTIAPLTQFVHIPDYDRYLIYFDFIMAVNGVPTNVNVQMIAGDTEGSVTMTPLATA